MDGRKTLQNIIKQMQRDIALIDEPVMIANFKNTSKNYQSAQRAAQQLEENSPEKTAWNNLENAKTFIEMMEALADYDHRSASEPEEESAYDCAAKALYFMIGFFSTKADFNYYATHLVRDILDYAVEHNYLKYKFIPYNNRSY